MTTYYFHPSGWVPPTRLVLVQSERGYGIPQYTGQGYNPRLRSSPPSRSPPTTTPPQKVERRQSLPVEEHKSEDVQAKVTRRASCSPPVNTFEDGSVPAFFPTIKDSTKIPPPVLPMKNGKKHGYCIIYQERGILDEGPFDEGLEYGVHKSYFDTGKLYTLSVFDAGQFHGIRTLFRPDGSIARQQFHQKGRLIWEQEFDANNQLI